MAKKIGYGQVEPNQLSAQKTGQIFASLKLDDEVQVLQNGEFMYYDYASGKVTATPKVPSKGEPMLVFNEIKIYEEWLSYKDFAMIRVGNNGNYVTNRGAVGTVTSMPIDPKTGEAGDTYGDGVMTIPAADAQHTEYPYRMDGFAPRMFKTNIGDLFTTNMLYEGDPTSPTDNAEDITTLTAGTILRLKKNAFSNTLQLAKAGTIGPEFMVVAQTTMPDGQAAVKLQRVS